MFEKNKTNIFLFIFVTLLIVFSFDAYSNYKRTSIEEAQLKLMQTDIEIKKENFLGDLLFQYHVDLQACFDFIAQDAELSEEKCIKEINQSRLAEKIKEWGGEDYLETIGEENR